MNRNSFADFFMGTAILASQRSPDLRKVGAVLVDNATNRIISTGYNGFPAGYNEKTLDLNNREEIYKRIIHAEVNCLLYADSSLFNKDRDLVLYVTKSPCSSCLTVIAAAGIKKLVYLEPYRDINQVEGVAKEYGIDLWQWDANSKTIQNLLTIFSLYE